MNNKTILPLRIGLGLMYLYSGFDLLSHPSAWVWAVPAWFTQAISPLVSLEGYLRIQGSGEIIMGLLFLAWFLPRFGLKTASALASLEIVSILLFTGINSITFRDIGLLGGILTLLYYSFQSSDA